jgi:hypothetical protein
LARDLKKESIHAALLCGTHQQAARSFTSAGSPFVHIGRQPVRSQRSLQYYQLRLVFATLASLLLLLFWRQ